MHVEADSSFKALLAELRKLRGRSQLQLAEDSAVSARHISFLETGRAHPTRAMVLKLAQALGAPRETLDRMLLASGFAPSDHWRIAAAPSISSAAAASAAQCALESAVSIQEAANVNAALAITARALGDLGLVHFFAGVLRPGRGNRPPEVAIHEGGRPPLAWLAHYQERNYRPHDPLIEATAREHRAFFWHEALESRPLSARQQRIFNEAGEFRIRSGLVVPVRWADGRVHAVSSMGERVEASDPRLRLRAQLVCTALLERLETEAGGMRFRDRPLRLRTRDAEFLKWTAAGFSKRSIADRNACTEEEVTSVLAEACVSLGASDARHAALRARRYGLLEL